MTQLNPQHKTNYRAEIDGLRAFAVLSVVVFHAFPEILTGGFVGVDVFFVISGFLITSHIFERLNEGAFSFTDFFGRRVRRIFPALVLVMAASLLFGWFVLLADEYSQQARHVASGAAFIINFILAGEVGYFDTVAELKPMLHLWSLAIEEQFYIFWPLCLWLVWKKKFNLLVPTLLVLVASFLVNVYWVISRPTETFFWPFGRFWELLSGSVLAWFVVYQHKFIDLDQSKSANYFSTVLANVRLFLSSHLATNVMSLIGLGVLGLSALLINKSLPWPYTWAILPVVGALLVIGAGAKSKLNQFILTNRVAVWFGLISYPLYLWHWPILSYLYIVEEGLPNRDKRIIAVVLSILLAWITYKFIETPIRLNKSRRRSISVMLVGAILTVGTLGFFLSITDLSSTHSVDKVVWRKGLEHKIGSSSRWYEGKNDWLFLGNHYERTVEKLKLVAEPTIDEIKALRAAVSEIAATAGGSATKVALLLGPNKSTIYAENLPDQLSLSSERYFSFYASALEGIPNFIFHDPTNDLLLKKELEGKLYYRTDTHWNSKGAFLAFDGLTEKLGVPSPAVQFQPGGFYEGDLIEISRLNNFAQHEDDNWLFSFEQKPELVQKVSSDLPLTSFGARETVLNADALSKQRVWVVGDSFTKALRPFINATFSEVYYLGHWDKQVDSLLSDLESASEKPDLILIVRVERAF